MTRIRTSIIITLLVTLMVGTSSLTAFAISPGPSNVRAKIINSSLPASIVVSWSAQSSAVQYKIVRQVKVNNVYRDDSSKSPVYTKYLAVKDTIKTNGQYRYKVNSLINKTWSSSSYSNEIRIGFVIISKK